MISLKLLSCFKTLVDTQSFTKTADLLCMTQSTVSKNIKQLEQILNAPLLIKNNKKRAVILTQVGTITYQHAKILLQQQKNLLNDVDNYHSLKTGTLKMGVPPLGAQLITSTLVAFHKQCPAIELSFLEVGSKGIEDALLKNDLDIGVVLEPLNSLFQGIQLCDYPLMVVLRRDSHWANRQNINLKELSNQAFLMFQENFSLNDIILNACRQQGFEPSIVCRTSQWTLLVDMVDQRLGITLLPKYYTDQLDPNKFIAIELAQPNLRWNLSFAWKKNSYLSPALQQCIKIIKTFKQ